MSSFSHDQEIVGQLLLNWIKKLHTRILRYEYWKINLIKIYSRECRIYIFSRERNAARRNDTYCYQQTRATIHIDWYNCKGKLKELGWEKAVYLRSSSNRKEFEGIFWLSLLTISLISLTTCSPYMVQNSKETTFIIVFWNLNQLKTQLASLDTLGVPYLSSQNIVLIR